MDLFLVLAPIDKAVFVVALLIVLFVPGLLRGLNDPERFGGWGWLLMYVGIGFYLVGFTVVNFYGYLLAGLVGVLISIILCILAAMVIKWN